MPALARGLLTAAVLLALAPVADAQDFPIRWGRLSPAEIAMTEVPGDPDATAIVLGDVGEDQLDPTRDGTVRYTRRRHRRVKVLSEAGYSEGEFSFRYSGDSKVHRVRAHTLLPQPDGDVRAVEVGRDAIFREEVRDGVQEIRFTMPALAPGAIFEIEYTYESDNYVALPAWYFQSSHPTVVSEYRVTAPAALEYVALTQGDVAAETRKTGRLYGDAAELTWRARDVPALREEPYTTTFEDYTTRVELQLSRIVVPGQFPQSVLTSWPEVAEALDKNPRFGGRVATSRLRRAQVEGLTGTRDEKMKAVYDMIRTGYASAGGGGIFAERDLNDVVETKSGTDAERTLLLAALLEDLDVPVHVAVLSTRSNGRPVQLYPIVSQFNRAMVIAQKEDGGWVTLDPTDRNRPFGVLPVESLNDLAWITSRSEPRWVNVPPATGTSTTSYVTGVLGDDGALSGSLQLRLSGYDAERARDRMLAEAADAPAQAAANAETLAEAADADDGVTILDVAVTDLDDVDAPLAMSATFEAGAGERIGDELYVTPFVLMQLDENPFERPTRAFPVDFAYPFSRTYIASLALPEGYVPAEAVPPLKLTIPSRAVSYTRILGIEDGTLTVRAVLSVNQAQVDPSEYPALRRLYQEIVAAEAEAVVLVRSDLAEADEPAPPEAPGDGASETSGDAEGGQ